MKLQDGVQVNPLRSLQHVNATVPYSRTDWRFPLLNVLGSLTAETDFSVRRTTTIFARSRKLELLAGKSGNLALGYIFLMHLITRVKLYNSFPVQSPLLSTSRRSGTFVV